MRFRYVAYDPSRHGRRERFEQLQSLFNVLLLKTGGDVDEALHVLELLDRRYGWFDEDYTLADFKADLEAKGRIKRDGNLGHHVGHKLTGLGERMLRREALERVFTNLQGSGGGDHRTPHAGGDGEVTDETRAYAFGDPIERIAWLPTMRNVLTRSAGASMESGWFQPREEDIEVHDHEQHAGCATVLLIDISHSMILYGEDRMLPAREVSLALLELITSRYKKDTLDCVLFGDAAHHVPLHEIPYIQAGPFHTNTKAGLQMAQQLLARRRHVNKQIFMITDGKPSCIERDGRLYKNPFGLDDEIRNRTLDEALKCRRQDIPVTTFMLARDPILVDFIEEFTEHNRGRAYFTSLEDLGTTLFVDYLANRRRRL